LQRKKNTFRRDIIEDRRLCPGAATWRSRLNNVVWRLTGAAT